MQRRTFLGTAAMVAAGLTGRKVRGAEQPGPMRIGQIGTAHAHAAGKLAAMRAWPADWEIAGLVVPEAEREAAERNARAYAGVPRMTEAELLALPGLRAVAVETRIEDACATALRAIRAGKHVHLDKPGALRHAEFRAMRTEAERRGLTVQMGYMLRYQPAFELAFRAVREGRLGDVRSIDAEMGKLAGAAELAQIRALPGGGMFELGCHPIDAIVTLLGRPAEVAGFRTPSQAGGVLDNQLAVLAYPRATATVRTNFVDPFGSVRRRFSITGTGGSLELLPMESGKVTLSLTAPWGEFRKGTQTLTLERKGGRYDGEFADLARVVRGEKPLAWDAAHDLAVHETVLRASGLGVE
jgi:predicted dehydrogenase